MQLAVFWPATHGSQPRQPHAYDDERKSQRSWAAMVTTLARGLADIGYAPAAIFMGAAVVRASIRTPLQVLP
jgi:hypothetical protein